MWCSVVFQLVPSVRRIAVLTKDNNKVQENIETLQDNVDLATGAYTWLLTFCTYELTFWLLV